MDNPSKNIYIGFISPPNPPRNKPKWWKRLLMFMLRLILPAANPDYDKRLYEVYYWLVEFDGVSQIPIREIGLSPDKEVIMIMPHHRNYGYWTDTHYLLKDFQREFRAVEITRGEFINSWNTYINNNS